jgi:transcription elongation GreA/GreB family factor
MSVAFVREESAEAAQEVSLPPRAISAHPNLVTQSGLRALERALADSQQALKAAQAIEDANERRRALELAARDARYFAERVASAVTQPDPVDAGVVAFGSQVTILRDDGRRQTFRIVGEDEADPRGGSIAYVSPLAHRLIGKRVGEAVGMAGHEIEIVAIEWRGDRRRVVVNWRRDSWARSGPPRSL